MKQDINDIYEEKEQSTGHEQKTDSTNETMSDTERTRENMLKAKKHALENRDPKTAWVALALKRYLEKTADMDE